MPYIDPLKRKILDPPIASLTKKIKTSGELNYVFTKLLLGQKPKCYEDYNRLMGMLEGCEKEYERRTGIKNILKEFKEDFYKDYIAPYEDKKIKENGDVYN